MTSPSRTRCSACCSRCRSGKTIVAALAALQAIENDYQVALMAPTEILAEQHYLKLRDWLEPLGIAPVWLSGSLKKKDKQLAAEKIAGGETLLAIGTHALFQSSVEFHKLAWRSSTNSTSSACSSGWRCATRVQSRTN